jgi:hypothetical protein
MEKEMNMNIKSRPVHMIVAATAVTLGLSGASALTCGSAHASGLSVFLEELGGVLARQTRVELPLAAHDVAVAAGPAIAAAGENESAYRTVMKAACAVNDLWLAHKSADLEGANPAEREAVIAEANQLQVTPSATVAVLCAFKRK